MADVTGITLMDSLDSTFGFIATLVSHHVSRQLRFPKRHCPAISASRALRHFFRDGTLDSVRRRARGVKPLDFPCCADAVALANPSLPYSRLPDLHPLLISGGVYGH